MGNNNPEKLLMPFTNKGKSVSFNFFSGIDTGTENRDSEKNLEPMWTRSATGANSMCSTVCGHQRRTTEVM